MTDIPPAAVELAQERAHEYYTLALPYHNFGHVQETVAYFHELCDRLATHAVYVPRGVGTVALYFHDANYHLDHLQAGYATKEQYAAAIAERELSELVTCEQISHVQRAILATHVEAVPQDNLEKAVRHSDVGNVYRDYVGFLRAFGRLTHEAIVLGQPLAESFEQQRAFSMAFVERYTQPMQFESVNGEAVSLPPDCNHAAANIARFLGCKLTDIIQFHPDVRRYFPFDWFTRQQS